MADLAADHLPVEPALEAACQALGTTPGLADAAMLRCARAGIRAEREPIARLAEEHDAAYVPACLPGECGPLCGKPASFADLIREQSPDAESSRAELCGCRCKHPKGKSG
jgi:hypothetical protein